MRSSRSGSAILFCLALCTIAVMVGYGFLRAAARQNISGKSEMMIALAQSAAQSGLAHATEQILVDYTTTSLPIADSTGLVDVGPRPTFLDGPYRAPFVSFTNPNILAGSQVGDPAEADDVPEENHLLTPFQKRREDGYAGSGWHNSMGCQIYDGRGRYIEVAYHNVTRPSPIAANPVPVDPLRITDLSAAVPERSQGIFLDENLHRISSGSPANDRQNARYRVRYAVGVTDLQGQILSNPLGNLTYDWKNPNNDYRKPTPWLDRSGDAFYNMVSVWQGNHRAMAVRMEHVFRGRGASSNTDRAWVAGSRNGLPATYPKMFRSTNNGSANGLFYTFLYNGNSRPYIAPAVNEEGRLFSYGGDASWGFETIVANRDGGEILTPTTFNMCIPYEHALMGPQMSWFNQSFALNGQVSNSWGGGNDGPDSTMEWGNLRSVMLSLPTPFGRRLETSAAAPANWTWYQGRVDTPWYVNLLTAAPQTISTMLLAYIPPHLTTLHYNREDWHMSTGLDAQGNDIYNWAVIDSTNPISKDISFPGRDILTDRLTSGLSEFPAPSTGAGLTLIKPNYYQDLLEPRPVAERYPGPLLRGDSANVNEGSDDLGKDINVDSKAIGRCTHTGQPLLYLGGGDYIENRIVAGVHYAVVVRIDTSKYTYKFSYYWDMLRAMSTALSYTRATWVQYPNAVFVPTTGFFPASLRDPNGHKTLQQLDELFLRQLGESFTSPGSRCTQKPILVNQDANGFVNFTVDTADVSNTIRTLVDSDLIKTTPGVTSIERAKVMERMLNDFRMSFLGASPEYCDDFRPLDFDGDGKVMCSCYDINPAPVGNETLHKTSRWATVVAAGQGPALVDHVTNVDPDIGASPWFSATGCFYIGKSRYFRVLARGEVYDNLLKKPVSAQTLETVIVVDPEAPRIPVSGNAPVQNHTLFQRWHYNDVTTELPRQLR